jgi:hypothetical protein
MGWKETNQWINDNLKTVLGIEKRKEPVFKSE